MADLLVFWTGLFSSRLSVFWSQWLCAYCMKRGGGEKKKKAYGESIPQLLFFFTTSGSQNKKWKKKKERLYTKAAGCTPSLWNTLRFGIRLSFLHNNQPFFYYVVVASPFSDKAKCPFIIYSAPWYGKKKKKEKRKSNAIKFVASECGVWKVGHQ